MEYLKVAGAFLAEAGAGAQAGDGNKPPVGEHLQAYHLGKDDV